MSKPSDSDNTVHPVLRIVANHRTLVAAFLDDEAEQTRVLRAAASLAERMLPDMAYVDEPDHPMAGSVYFCNASLAVFLTLRPMGIDAHDYGARMLDEMRRTYKPPEIDATVPLTKRLAKLAEAGRLSPTTAKPNEFVYEVQIASDDSNDWAMNVHSCAICASYGKHDAMDLVPYMCATDDVMSDLSNDGLRRTGSIALGATHCDFRYRSNSEPRRLAAQYPDRIRVTEV